METSKCGEPLLTERIDVKRGLSYISKAIGGVFMKNIQSFEAWETVRQQDQPFLLFVKTNHCSVCEGLYPQVEALQEQYQMPFYMVNAAEVPEMAGQLSLFTAPVVLLYAEGKEFARFARFVPMDELKYRIEQLLDGGDVL